MYYEHLGLPREPIRLLEENYQALRTNNLVESVTPNLVFDQEFTGVQ